MLSFIEVDLKNKFTDKNTTNSAVQIFRHIKVYRRYKPNLVSLSTTEHLATKYKKKKLLLQKPKSHLSENS